MQQLDKLGFEAHAETHPSILKKARSECCVLLGYS